MGDSAADLSLGKPAADFADFALTRRFIDVDGRRVHVRIMGSGPPAIFIHSSPANSSFVLPEMASVAERFTCYAFDTPGFGLSDPLPGEALTMPELADALAKTLAAIGMPPCPVFGCHTGAAIALELALRHPRRVTGLVLDALCCFTDDELAAVEAGYFIKIPLDPLGGHFSAIWTRFRDQSTWFPWFARDPDHLNESDLTSPAATNRWVTMFFDAQHTYAPAYRAALAYQDGPAAVRRLTVPMVLTAIEADMLYPHLDRIDPAGPEQQVVRVGNSVAARRALTSDALIRFAGGKAAPSLPSKLTSSAQVLRQFVDLAHGQLLVRSLGDRTKPPLLLIHDVPGSGMQAEARMHELARDRFVMVFDLPGCSESAPLETPTLADFAECLWHGLTTLGFDRAALAGTGFGSSLALEMAELAPQRTMSLLLEGVLLPTAAERAELRAHFAPPVDIAGDGSHWFRTWQMIRDMGIWWPWFRPAQAALRRVAADFDAASLHQRTCETLRQPGGYCAYVAAALDHDAASALNRLQVTPHFVRDSLNPVATAYAAEVRRLCPAAEWVE